MTAPSTVPGFYGRSRGPCGTLFHVRVDIVTEVEIDCPREAVSRYAADPDNAPEWYQDIASVEWLSAPPLALGSRLAFVASFLGRRLAYTYEVREFAPPPNDSS
jgi:Polyketide cyclase / dehydrase and lipid transport